MGLLDRFTAVFKGRPQPETEPVPNTEIGRRATPEASLLYQYRQAMWVDPELRSTILDVRKMDREDGRVKAIHRRLARDAVKSGLLLSNPSNNKRLDRACKDYVRRLRLDRPDKLRSDARGFAIEGNLAMQWVIGPDQRLEACVRMPSETILPRVDANGRFSDVARAYDQFDLTTGGRLASFPLGLLTLARLEPDSFDDMGALGRPYLDATRTVWRKLVMTEEDLVIRRRTRAPLRIAHILEGAKKEELEEYRKRVEDDQGELTTDFYMNRKGAVTAVQGDANLDQIEDMLLLLDAFFAGSPAPKGLFGYSKDMARDILEDVKRDYYEEVDGMQDILAYVYRQGFELDLLLAGMNPDAFNFDVSFAERRTETPNQAADRGLKYQAMGLPKSMVWETVGADPAEVRERLKVEAGDNDPYPEPNNITSGNGASGAPSVKITPGNQRKGESGTAIGHCARSEAADQGAARGVRGEGRDTRARGGDDAGEGGVGGAEGGDDEQGKTGEECGITSRLSRGLP